MCHMITCIKWQFSHHMDLMPCAPLSFHVATTWSCYVAPLLVSPDTLKNVKFRLSRNSTKFNWVTRFRETIPMVKSVLSSNIYKNSRFSIVLLRQLSFCHFFSKIEFFPGFTRGDFLKLKLSDLGGFLPVYHAPKGKGFFLPWLTFHL